MSVLITPSISEDKFFMNSSYLKLLSNYNKNVIILNYYENPLNYLNKATHLILSGGGDIDPKYFNNKKLPTDDLVLARRDEVEIMLSKEAFLRNIPTLGICRGCQVMNVAMGGSIIQNIDNHKQTNYRDIPTHFVNIKEDTILYKIINKKKIKVNSFHHQAVGSIGDNLIKNCTSYDNYTEGIEGIEHRFFLGLQWHPEEMPKDINTKKIFDYFINM